MTTQNQTFYMHGVEASPNKTMTNSPAQLDFVCVNHETNRDLGNEKEKIPSASIKAWGFSSRFRALAELFWRGRQASSEYPASTFGGRPPRVQRIHNLSSSAQANKLMHNDPPLTIPQGGNL